MESSLSHLHENSPEIKRIMRIMGRFKSRPSAEVALERFQQVLAIILESVHPDPVNPEPVKLEVEVFFERYIEKRESPISYNIQEIIASHLTPYEYSTDFSDTLRIDEGRDIGYFRVKNIVSKEIQEMTQKVMQRLIQEIITIYIDLYASVMEERINLAFIDALTRIPNRLGLLRATNELFSPGEDNNILSDTPFSVILFDLDFFKNINTRFGHGGGDIALEFTAKRLSEFVEYICDKYSIKEENILIARLGGEEFVMMLLGVDEVLSREIASELVKYISKEPVELIPDDVGVNIDSQSSLKTLLVQYIKKRVHELVQYTSGKPVEPLPDTVGEDIEQKSAIKTPIAEFIKISAGVSTYSPSTPLKLKEIIEFLNSQKGIKFIPLDANMEDIVIAIKSLHSSGKSFSPVPGRHINKADTAMQKAKDNGRNGFVHFLDGIKILPNIRAGRELKKSLESSLRGVDNKEDILKILMTILWENSKFNFSARMKKWLITKDSKKTADNSTREG